MHNRRVVKHYRRHPVKCGDCILDAQQSEAVVACEDAQLVLASAGSGKTMSLLAKVEYLHNELGILPEQILVISFTKKTVVELIERCAVKSIEVRTFHGLGNSIISSANSDLGARKLVGEGEIASFIYRSVQSLRMGDMQFARDLNDYILLYFSAPKNPGNFKDFASRISFNRQFLRRVVDKNETIFTRSKEEQLIANWL